ncbi:hypothetical protein Tco_1050427 [Tanacetum coccineum]
MHVTKNRASTSATNMHHSLQNMIGSPDSSSMRGQGKYSDCVVKFSLRSMRVSNLEPLCIQRRERHDVEYQWVSINESNDKENDASTIHEESIAKNVDKSMDPIKMEKLTKTESSDLEEK